MEKKAEPQKQKRQLGGIEDLTNLLQLIDSNPNPTILQSLLSFMNLKTTN